ncbi:uncharacterized protein IUM83_12082 [Phytophthora cinnamomi]|uniref:uncharacterized protein n=1 Tax=Phytophthora cinnamomi TaxID=4785 RepID=UPI00355A5593|nr:hypothetical protein IUM83_12082 [Phytophthora cinnamomi]
MASDELESAEPERGAAPPELPVGPESDSAVPELLCAVVDSDDELEADAESAVTDASVAADLDVADVELAELELDSATAALALSRESSEQLSPDAEEYKMPNLGPRSVDRI